jgi:fructan beta-fructosidase
VVPTSTWRSANTIPRDLSLKKIDNRYYVASSISPELLNDVSTEKSFDVINLNGSLPINDDKLVDLSKSIFTGTFEAKDFTIELSNERNQKLVIGFKANENRFYVDRSKSGNTKFSDGFITVPYAPRVLKDSAIKVQVVMDVSSVEVFFDNGLTVMTSVFFPDSPLTNVTLQGASVKVEDVNVKVLNSIWQ